MYGKGFKKILMVFSFTLDFRTQKSELLKYFMAGDCLLMAGDIYQNLPSQPKTVSCLLPLIKPLIRTPQLSKLKEWFRDHTFMAPTQKGVGGGVLKFVICMRILLFLSKRAIVHLYRWGGRIWARGTQNWSFFVKVTNV